MKEAKSISLPLSPKTVGGLRCGDLVLLSGDVITGRDMAHKRLCAMISDGAKLPVDIKGETIYYVGAAPAKPGHACGSAGPTSSKRMDAFTPMLMDNGLLGMIGKGRRSAAVKEAIVKRRGIYFCAIGGAGALMSKAITRSELICFGDLGTEAVYRYTLKDFPCIVGIDSTGKDIFERGEAAE